MSNYTPKPNTGTLWPNQKKASANHPDVRGDVFIDRIFLQDMCDKADGDLVKLQIAGWNKVIAGKDCLSISVSAPYEKPRAASYEKPREVAPRSDEDVPF